MSKASWFAQGPPAARTRSLLPFLAPFSDRLPVVVVDEFVEFIDGSSSKTSKRNPPISYEPSLPRASPPRA